ncbi:hypothetical protein [Catellatospora coxensis]|uniref:Uncharacterized protein n=1 Tax=Catellatospora coxensis TaxID=310354 RepID=A0A8J3LEG0_9ACTN|nr:hypothetical protein [Catellatospora coxensis]GIG11205.1 hypothetical protein Cco03nite_79050 [Catellatospora coxensis]
MHEPTTRTGSIGAGASGRAAYPRVSPCRHCSRPVLRDNDGRWIHADLSYVCRDLWGGLAETTAEPAAAPRV